MKTKKLLSVLVFVATAQQYGVSYPPYVLILDANNNVINRVAGTVDAPTFLPIR